MGSKNRIWAEINLKELENNFVKIQNFVSPSQVKAVLKANAYGLGVMPIAERLAKLNVHSFGVADLQEAENIASLNIPTQILGGVMEEELSDAVKGGYILPITDLDIAKKISHESVKQNKVTECHFKIDTGMGRLGLLLSEAFDVIQKVVQLPNLNCSGIYSHFPIAYKPHNEFTNNQIKQFVSLINRLSEVNINFTQIHIANSDAINNYNSVVSKSPFNIVRTGINLLGAFDNEGEKALNINSVLNVKTRLVNVRKLPAGYTVGYGNTYRLVNDALVGTIAAGYADGLPLNLSNRGYVIVRDRLCPIIGKVSMDYTTVLLNFSESDNIQRGEEVICLGKSENQEITIENWAQIKGTHSYDILCSIGNRVERIYI